MSTLATILAYVAFRIRTLLVYINPAAGPLQPAVYAHVDDGRLAAGVSLAQSRTKRLEVFQFLSGHSHAPGDVCQVQGTGESLAPGLPNMYSTPSAMSIWARACFSVIVGMADKCFPYWLSATGQLKGAACS